MTARVGPASALTRLADPWRAKRREPSDKERPMSTALERARAAVYRDLRAWYRRVVPTLAPAALEAGTRDELVIVMDPGSGALRLVARAPDRAQLLAEAGDAWTDAGRAALADVLTAGLNELAPAARAAVAAALEAHAAALVALWFLDSDTLVGALVPVDGTPPVRLFTLGPVGH